MDFNFIKELNIVKDTRSYQYKCKICDQGKATIACLPCGHITMCYACWYRAAPRIECPYCGRRRVCCTMPYR